MEKGLTMVAHAINVGNDGVYATVDMWGGGIVVQPGAEIKPEMLSAGNGSGIHSDSVNYHVYKTCLEIRYC